MCNSNAINITRNLIEACKLTTAEVKYFRYGRCGVFALALYDALREQNIVSDIYAVVAVCKSKRHGSLPVYMSKDGHEWSFAWNHAVVMVQGAIFDAGGLQDKDAILSEYSFYESKHVLRKWSRFGLSRDMRADHDQYDKLQQNPLLTYYTPRLYNSVRRLLQGNRDDGLIIRLNEKDC